MADQAVLKQLISKFPLLVFSKSYCPFCIRAKELLQSLAPGKAKIYEIDQLTKQDGEELKTSDGAQVQSQLKQLTS